MESREHERARDDALDARIDELHTGAVETFASSNAEESVAREFARLAAEESPRLSTAARNRGLAALRAQAAAKRRAARPAPFAFLARMPRWAQMAAVALLVVVVANGVTSAAADSLPGSLLYPFKRITEGGQLFMQNSNAQRARIWMNLANTRLDEIHRLLQSGAQVDPSLLDAVDESIVRVLSELAGTRGAERVELLKMLTQLAIRQQQIIQEMAVTASPEQRARLEQTAKLLQDVANFAASDAAVEPELNPLEFLTPFWMPTPDSTLPFTATPTPTATMTPTVTPTATATPTPTANSSQENTIANSSGVPTPTLVSGAQPVASNTPYEDSTTTPGQGGEPQETPNPSATDEPDETDAPEPTDKPEPTDAPEPTDKPEPTDAPEPTDKPEPTDAPEPTDEPEPTDAPEPTDEPEPTDAPEPTDEPEPTDKPEPTDEPEPTDAPEPTDEPEPTDAPDTMVQSSQLWAWSEMNPGYLARFFWPVSFLQTHAFS